MVLQSLRPPICTNASRELSVKRKGVLPGRKLGTRLWFLRVLERAPFEPLDTVDMKWVSCKLAVLILLTTARGSEITALTCQNLLFSAGDTQVTVYPDPGFKPKTVDELQRRAPVVFHAFFLSPVMEESISFYPAQSVRFVLLLRVPRPFVERIGCRLLIACRAQGLLSLRRDWPIG